jgi:hypothetical protein
MSGSWLLAMIHKLELWSLKDFQVVLRDEKRDRERFLQTKSNWTMGPWPDWVQCPSLRSPVICSLQNFVANNIVLRILGIISSRSVGS